MQLHNEVKNANQVMRTALPHISTAIDGTGVMRNISSV